MIDSDGGSGVENCGREQCCGVCCWADDAVIEDIRLKILSSLASCRAKEHSSRSTIIRKRQSSELVSFPWRVKKQVQSQY